MKIAIFDYLVTSTNPAGSCHRALIDALADEHDFTVFSNRLDNPTPQKIRWNPVPVIRRPLAALFLTFHVTAVLSYLRVRRRNEAFALIQSVESNFAFADLVYSHFCHRGFLKHHWKECRVGGLRGIFRWIDHALHALAEPWVFRRAHWIVVPSAGLKKELSAEYPAAAQKISVIPNPVDLDSFQRPVRFDRQELRRRLGIGDKELMVVFIALGHFERKGLPLLLEALASAPKGLWKLVVVGGTQATVTQYEQRAAALGLDRSVQFVGYQHDIRPFLWSSDLFAMPSRYESFFLAALQAAAAGCPILITQLNGADEYLNSSNAFIVTPDVPSISSALTRFKSQSSHEREALANRARHAASTYGLEEFALAWRTLYRRIGQTATNV